MFLSSIVALLLLQPAAVLTAVAQPAPKVISKTDQSTVIVKFKADTAIGLSNNDFKRSGGPAGNQTDATLNALLSQDKVVSKRQLIPEKTETIKLRRSQLTAPLAPSEGNLENYYVLKLAPGKKADDIATQLKALPTVETAYAKPLPAPAPVTPNYSSQQGYLKPAPTGLDIYATIGAVAGKPYPGATGNTVRVADLEYSWNTQHEDISRLRLTDAVWTNGTPVDPFNNTNHGTAAAGMVAADRNSAGVNGIVPNTSFHTLNVNNLERGYDLSNSIYIAANKMAAGDIILLEQQAWAPNYEGFAPVEIQPDVYDAIRYAVAKGITVIEPAGNGKSSGGQGYNLDDPLFGGAFTTKANSGAIMVGAASSGCNPSVAARARLAFSNFGSRVDVQAYGDCVTTTGYGDLYSADLNTQYTARFSGTSSASAAIAGVAAQLSSSYEHINKVAMKPAALKSALQKDATPQNTTVNPGNIGPMPNMAAALKTTDIKKPTTPTNLTGKLISTNKISLSWTASTDNLGYVRYNIYRGSTLLTQVSGTTYTDTSITTKTTFTYKVVAVDASKNLSTASNSVSVTNR